MKTSNGEYTEYKGYGLQCVKKFIGNQCHTIALIGIPKQDPFYDVNVFAVPFNGYNAVFSRDDTFCGPKKSKRYAWFSRYFDKDDMASTILRAAVDWRLGQYTHTAFYADNEPYHIISSATHVDLDVDKIIYSGPKTIVLWNDGTKTIVSCGEDDEFDEYAGFCAAFAKKLIGSTSKIKRIIDQKARFHNMPEQTTMDTHAIIEKLKEMANQVESLSLGFNRFNNLFSDKEEQK